jgi:oligopeptide transport system permease protein
LKANVKILGYFLWFPVFLAIVSWVCLYLFTEPSQFHPDLEISNPLVYEKLNSVFNLKASIGHRWVEFWLQFYHGDFVRSIAFPGQTILEVAVDAIGITLRLTLPALGLAIGTSLLMARYGNRLRTFQIFLTSLPLLSLAAIMIAVLVFKFEVLTLRMDGGWRFWVLPVFLFSLKPMATLSRLLSIQVDREAQSIWYVAKRSHGFSKGEIFFPYMIKTVALSVFGYLGPLISSLFVGSMFVENLFSIPGLGFCFLTSIQKFDGPLFGMLTLIFAIIFYCVQLGLDFCKFQFFPNPQLNGFQC